MHVDVRAKLSGSRGSGKSRCEEVRPRLPVAPPSNINVFAGELPTNTEAKGKKIGRTSLVEGSVVIKTSGAFEVPPIACKANTWLTVRGVQDLPAQIRFD